MKKERRLLALILCLCMLFSMVPAGAAELPAAEQPPQESQNVPETPKESPEQAEGEEKEPDAPAVLPEDSEGAPSESNHPVQPEEDTETDGEAEALEKSVSPFTTQVPGDGAKDDWKQEAASVQGEGSICEFDTDSNSLHLKSGSSNINNSDAGVGPAIFIDETMNHALANADGEKFLSMDITVASSPMHNTCFGIYLNYKSRSECFLIGFNGNGKAENSSWFRQQYIPGSNYWPNFSAPIPEVGEPFHFEVVWTDDEIKSVTIDGVDCLPAESLREVTAAVGLVDKVAFKLGTYSGVQSEVYLSNIHYTGQATITGYDVSGTVTEAGGSTPVAGAAVTIGGKTATTGADGTYSVLGLLPGEYTGTVTREGYKPGTIEIFAISDGDIAGKDVSLTMLPVISGRVTDNGETPKPVQYAVVALGDTGRTAVTDADGNYTIRGVEPGSYTLKVTAENYEPATLEGVTVEDENVTGKDVQLVPIPVRTAVLSTDDMDVLVDLDFPRAIQYDMKGGLEGKTFYGQTTILDTVTINGVDVAPAVESAVAESGDRITYTMTAQGTNIDCVIHAELAAEGKVLSFNINRIDNNLDEIEYPVERISIPNHSLISVRSNQEGANFIGNRLATNTITSGDFRYAADQFAGADNQRFIYGFVSNDELSAGIASNSEWGTGGAGSNNNRVLANTEDRGAYISLGLSSSEWYYDRKVSSSDPNPINNAVIPDSQKVVGPTELPLYAKVVVTGDENGNGEISWQDAAIVARDTIVHKPFKSEEIPELVTTRIALNFGSQAQNPFLTSLDNVKRVYLNTDGLGQSILLKGYGNEGHDSGHGDYADVGTRMGGVPDMLTMMEEGAELGARFGIHVNASEFYPESKSFSDKTVRRTNSGDLRYGWNWLDQGVGINGLYDLASGNRANRFKALADEMNGLLDFIYVDVWGNLTSGNSEDAWQTRKLSQELVDNGWRVTTEWSYGMEWESTFQHWVADYTYGDYTHKGRYNSEVERFLLNSYKDTFAADYPRYGGNANAPLLGGAAMQGFEGWQKDGEYDEHIESIFEHQIPAKFLQHYDIMEWVDAASPVALPWSQSSGSSAGGTASWTPEAKITLQSADRESTVVVTRGTDPDTATTKAFAYDTDDDKQEYRARTITLDGKEILRGTPVPATNESGQWGGDTETENLRTLANQQYLIPWLWDKDGNELAAADQKLYHRNDVGGSSTWELPDGWESLTNVKMYELTDNGRVNETIVPVENGSVTLKAEAKTPYVIVKGDAAAQAPAVVWSTGLYLRDVGFNSAAIEDNWTVTGAGTAVRYLNQDAQSVLKMAGAVSVSQEYNSLEPGKKYVTYVSVDNRSDAKAAMTVTDENGQVLASNYTERSIAINYISGYSINTTHPIEAGSSKFQNMFVFFTAPESGRVTLTLSREAGEGNTYFDDVRTLETAADNYTYDDEGNIVKFTQDFEHVAQGEFPFVVGPGSGGIEDNYQHLSERHDPYTSAGWNIRETDDVLDGNWSLKLGDRNGKNNLTFQTIPQNFRFEPGVTYTVAFDYQMGTAGDYEVISGVGEYSGSNYTVVATLKQARGTTATCKFTLVGDPTGQTWIGLRRTNALPITPGSGTNADIFAGHYDFVLDNLVIEVSGAQKGELAEIIAQADAMLQADYNGDWSAFTSALAAAKTVMNNQKATQAQVDGAVQTLDEAIKALTRKNIIVTGTVTMGESPAENVSIAVMDDNKQYLGATVTTGPDGTYTLEGVSSKTTQLRISTPGSTLQFVKVSDLVEGENEKNIALVKHSPAAYELSFEDWDTSMFVPASSDSTVKVTPTVYNGKSALLVTFTSDDPVRNALAIKDFKLTFSKISADITPLGKSGDLSLMIRGSEDGKSFVTMQQIGTTGTWGYAKYQDGALSSSYTAFKGQSMSTGETRRLYGDWIAFDGSDAVNYFVDDVQQLYVYTGYSVAPGYVGITGNSPGSFIISDFRVTPGSGEVLLEGTLQTVSGKVLAAGQPVVGAQIVLKDSAGKAVSRVITGTDGVYTTNIPAGTYTITAGSLGFAQGKLENVVVSNSALVAQDIVLTADDTQLKLSLETLYDSLKDKIDEGYTAESWAAFQTSLTEAKTILDKDSATQSEITKAYVDLNNALNNLKLTPPVPADKSALRTAYNTYNDYLITDYTSESWGPFRSALQTAAAVLKDTAATQSDIDAARDALMAAANALVRVGGGSVGGGSSNTTTETTKNPDGSTTTTVTNKTTGTTTETTIGTDGTKVVIETKKDGTSTTVVTLPKKPEGSVTLPGKPVSVGNTITIKTDKGADVIIPVKNVSPGIVPVIVKADGTEEIVKKSVTTDDGVAFYLNSSSVVKLQDNSKTFVDTDASHWAFNAVAFAASRELFQGVGADRFAPADPMTRSMLVTVLYRLENEPEAGEATFADVPAGTWYTDAVAWASASGIVTGTGAGFEPDGKITRESLAVMLYRYAEKLGLDTETDGMAAKGFSDSAGISAWAEEAMSWSVKNGILTGKSGGILDPGGTASRAEVATMLMRFVALL